MKRLSAPFAAVFAARLVAGLIVAAGVPVLSSAPAAGSGFVDGIDDLPLMPGLKAVDGLSVVFDNPGSRFIQTAAKGAMPAAAISSFYTRTLPQLGWRPAGEGRFQRDDEILQIDFPGAVPGGGTLVRFTLTPQ
ncbi:MAG TPA: hypothetical protein VEB64_14355 [Azospirillaceae bacterium]|nr:hypothetical protein [Azospirillaceae bacterium]